MQHGGEVEDLLSGVLLGVPVGSSACNSPQSPVTSYAADPPTSKEQEFPGPGEIILGHIKQPPSSPHESSQGDSVATTNSSSHSPPPGTPEREHPGEPF